MAGVFAPGGLAASPSPQKEWKEGDLAMTAGELNKLPQGEIEKLIYERAAVALIAVEQSGTLTARLPHQAILFSPKLRAKARKGQEPTAADIAAVDHNNGAAKLLFGLTELVNEFVDESTINCLKKKFKGKLRKIFERSGPTTQCRNVIGKLVADVTLCWICNTIIPQEAFGGDPNDIGDEDDEDDDDDEDDGEGGHPLKPECEHVFPVAQAVCFTGLYSGALHKTLAKQARNSNPRASIKDTEAFAYVEGLRAEYGWAHRVCNQVKNDLQFLELSESGDNPTYLVDMNRIKQFLMNILDSTKYKVRGVNGGTVLSNHIGISTRDQANQWIENQSKVIYDRCSLILQTAIGSVPGVSCKEFAVSTIADLRSYVISMPGCTEMIEKEIIATHYADRNNQISTETSETAIKQMQGIAKYLIGGFGGVANIVVSRVTGGAGGGVGLEVRESIKVNFMTEMLGSMLSCRLLGGIPRTFEGDPAPAIPPDQSLFPPAAMSALRMKVLRLIMNKLDQGGGIVLFNPIYVRRQLPLTPAQLALTPAQREAALDAAMEDDFVYEEAGRQPTRYPADQFTVWNFFNNWQTGVIAAHCLTLIRQNMPTYRALMASRWPALSISASFDQYWSIFEPLAAEYLHIRAKAIKNMLHGTSYSEIMDTSLVNPDGTQMTHAQLQIPNLSAWFMPGGKRKTRKRKSKKRKTYRKKRLF